MSNMLEIALERITTQQKNYVSMNPRNTGGNRTFVDLPAETELFSACVSTCVPLLRYIFGDPLVSEVRKINSLFAFHP